METQHFYMTAKKLKVVHIKSLKQELNPGIILKKVQNMISFNQDQWLKPQIEKITRLRKETKNDFETEFFKLMNNAVLEKHMKNAGKHGDIKLVIRERRSDYLVSEPSYYATKFFTENLLCSRNGKDPDNYE